MMQSDYPYECRNNWAGILFSSESLKNLIIVAYGLEHGLQELYEFMQSKVDHREVFALFAKPAMIEGRPKERSFREYQKLDANVTNKQDF